MKKQQVFYIHGGEAFSSYEKYLEYLRTVEIKDPHGVLEKPKRWPSFLREELGEAFELFQPTMPNKHAAHYEEWKIWFERHFEFLHDGIILIGWSQGGYFLAKYLSENTFPYTVKSLVLLAAPVESGDFGLEDGGDFVFDINQLPKMSEQVSSIYILHSKDDFVVPYEHALKYKEALPEAELVTLEDKNHFLVEELPELVELIKEVSER